MAIKFFNIRTKEVLTAETEPQISALWASSDHSPNITQGQDFGWRLAPEVVVAMKKIKQDMNQLMVIASRYNIGTNDIGEKEILQYISDRTAPESAQVATDADYSDEYNEEIRRLELADQSHTKPGETIAASTQEPETTTTTTEEPAPTEPVEPENSVNDMTEEPTTPVVE